VWGARRIVVLTWLTLLALSATAQARPPVPHGFVGVMADGPLLDPRVNLGAQLDQMVSSGIQSLRVTFDWSAAQPYANWHDVPAGQAGKFSRAPGGVPTDFRVTDEIVGLAAQRRLALLPVVVYSPRWDASPAGIHVQPRRAAPFANYLSVLVQRYGPRGSFWASHPRLPREPIRAWQIWNEPNIAFYWDTPHFARGYVSLLRAAGRAIKRADAGASIVLAALTNYSWLDLAAIYAVPGARRLFDVVGSNAYTSKPAGVITILDRVRRVMDSHGDRHKPLVATEVGWPSALGKTNQNYGINTTQRGQAEKLAQLLPMLARNRRRLGLSRFYYYTWLSSDTPHGPSFDFSGLLAFDPADAQIYAKPAYAVFRRVVLALEGRN
jgi:hypothetical protein